MSLMTEITIFVLAAFVGFEVISKVPTTLHTPLMSQTNAIHGIVMLGGLIVIGSADDTLEKVIGVIAIAFGTINIVGGFMVTDRMLGMFSGRKRKPKGAEQAQIGAPDGDPRINPGSPVSDQPRSRRCRPTATSSPPATSSPSPCSSSGSGRGRTRAPPGAAT